MRKNKKIINYFETFCELNRMVYNKNGKWTQKGVAVI
ncbi:MAG: hypothetical protein JWM44_2806 [Bacilli bacterium]|nr:hypothetical protein [Bacilli bacterium]